jgi:hypothetical protein
LGEVSGRWFSDQEKLRWETSWTPWRRRDGSTEPTRCGRYWSRSWLRRSDRVGRRCGADALCSRVRRGVYSGAVASRFAAAVGSGTWRPCDITRNREPCGLCGAQKATATWTFKLPIRSFRPKVAEMPRRKQEGRSFGGDTGSRRPRRLRAISSCENGSSPRRWR